MNNLLSSVPYKYRPLVIPVLTLVIVGMVLAVGAPIAVRKINSVKNQVQVLKTEEGVLREKINILSEINSNNKLAQTSTILVAVPDENPVLAMVSQLKKLAAEKGLTLVALQGAKSAISADQTSQAVVTFETSGTIEQVTGFMRDLEEMAPIMRVDNAGFAVDGDTLSAEISVKSLYAPLPEHIASVNKSITGLTNEEQKIFDRLTALDYPDFTFGVTIASVSGRVNPFAF